MAKSFEDLPEECCESVFHHLEQPRHLESVSLVCRRFFSISNRLRFNLIVSDPLQTVPGGVFKVLRRFHQLKRVVLVDFHGDLHRLILEISRSGLKLEALDISNQSRFPVRSMKILGENLKTLRNLNCSRFQFLQDSDLMAIADSFPLLEELDISYPDQDLGSSADLSLVSPDLFPGAVTDSGIQELSSKLRNLRAINISGNYFLSDDSIVALSSNCVSLSRIAAMDCSFISNTGVAFAVSHSQNLVSLSVSGSRISSSPVRSIFFEALELQCLDLTQTAITDDLLFCIRGANLPLRKLILARCEGFTILGISGLLQNCQYLNHLNLEGATFLTDESLTELVQNLQNLRFICLNSCSRLTNVSFFNILKICSSLEEVQMERTGLGTGIVTMEMDQKHRIRCLKLAWNRFLTNEILAVIAMTCSKLRSLDISHCRSVTDDGLSTIGKCCPEIIGLKVNGCGVSSLGPSSGFGKLELLDAAVSHFGDEGLFIVGKSCRELLRLNVEGCLGVTDTGLKEVVRFCTKLREVNLTKCAVNADFLVRMVFCRPSLRKIILPSESVPSEKQRSLLLRHGCLVCNR